MIYWFRSLPEGAKTKEEQAELLQDDWRPFIRDERFRDGFMRYVYSLQVVLIVVSSFLGVWKPFSYTEVLGILLCTFVVHESLHVVTVYAKGDISLTHKGVFFWLHTNAILNKWRFWLFMTLPILILSVGTAALALRSAGIVKDFWWAVAWINLIIAGSDLINSMLIFMKPRRSRFFEGKYRISGRNNQ